MIASDSGLAFKIFHVQISQLIQVACSFYCRIHQPEYCLLMFKWWVTHMNLKSHLRY